MLNGCGGSDDDTHRLPSTPFNVGSNRAINSNDPCVVQETLEDKRSSSLANTLNSADINGGQLTETGRIDSSERYLYAPSLMYDAQEGLYKFWACGDDNGDHIIFKSSSSLAGLNTEPWQLALEPSSNNSAFDHTHACDPSLIQAGNDMYLYYGGFNDDELFPTTRIGVAKSTNGGRTFRKLHEGRAIVQIETESREGYGIGQPAVTYNPNDRYYYMIYTHINCSGNLGECNTRYIKVIKSLDPGFGLGTQELVKSFNPDIIGSYSVDLAYDEASHQFVIIGNQDRSSGIEVMLLYLDSDFNILTRHYYNTDIATDISINTNINTNINDEPIETATEQLTSFRFGEGIAVLKTPQGAVHKIRQESEVVFAGATYNDNPLCPLPNHIAGPSRFAVFTEHSDI